MASPISPAQAYHSRFNAPTSAAANTDSSSTTAAAAPPARLSSDNYSYPDLDAGQYHSSVATHAGGVTASAPLAAGPLPSFPEFSAFDLDSEFTSTSQSKDDFFNRFSPTAAAPKSQMTTASQLVHLPLGADTAAQNQPMQSPRASQEGDRANINSKQQQREGGSRLASNDQSSPFATIVQTESQQQEEQQQDTPLSQLPDAQLERGFLSASMYQPPPAGTDAALPPLPEKSEQRGASNADRDVAVSPDVEGILPSSQHGASHSPAAAAAAANGPASPLKGALATDFTFPPSQSPGARAPAAAAAAQSQSQVDSLPVNDLQLGEQSQQQTQQPQQQQQFAERARPSSFFGMERPLAAVNASGQHVPVPRGMIPDDDHVLDHHDQRQNGQMGVHSNGLAAVSPVAQPAGQPQVQPQPRQQAPGAAANNGPRPLSFFGIEGSAPGTITPPAIPEDDQSVRGQHTSNHRSEGSYRGISTAASGTGNGPMPNSVSGDGFGGLCPSGATRPTSIAPTINSGPLLDHSHLKPGQKASLLSHGKTLELYRQNAKKTNDPNLIYELAVFMIDASKTMGGSAGGGGDDNHATSGSPANNSDDPSNGTAAKDELVKEATGLLKKIADRGHPDAQYFLADCYANGIGTAKGKQEFSQAYTYFVLAAKHGHPDAAYRAGTCYEKGWGCRKDNGKALQFYRKAASQNHPGAMYRLATAELNGELGLRKSAKEGVKWLKRSAEAATPEFPHALHELALLHERGIDNVLFVDPEYSCELLAQAGEMGYAPSAYKLGVNYEYGRMGCPQDGGLSIHMYNIAAQQNHKEACFALTAWYLVGAPGILPQSDTEAYLWAKKAAEQGLAKAEYAVGYFTEMGIGTVKDLAEAKAWYRSAAEHGDKRANQRLAALGRHHEKTLAGVGAGGGLQQNGRSAAAAISTDYGKRGQPTSAPFPSSVDRSSMAHSAQMSYPSPIVMRDAQTAQREQQYLANVAATERAQAQQQQARAAPPRSGPSSVASPKTNTAARPFSQAYPSYPASTSASGTMPQPPGFSGQPPLLGAAGAEANLRTGLASPLSPSSPDGGEDGKKKKKWFGRS